MNSWYRKQLLSYFPIFLLTITVIVLLGLVVVSDISRKETEKANRMSAKYVADTMVRSLNDIERAVLQELDANGSIASFSEASERGERDESLLLYGVSQSLRSLMEANPAIHSIYLYRSEDGLIVWPNGKTSIESFGDRTFLEPIVAGGVQTTDRWSDLRRINDRFAPSSAPVISLVKQLPLPFGDRGLAVINADVLELQSYVDGIADRNVTYLDVVDSAGQLVMSTDAGASNSGRGSGAKQLTEVELPETGWKILSGIKQGRLFGWFSLISYIWLAIGCVVIALSLGYVIYISKRNYRPIQMMMNKLESIQLKSLPDDRKADDLSFIGHALEDLIVQSRHYEQDRREHLVTRRRQLFLDLLEGTGGVDAADGEEVVPLPREAGAANENFFVVAAEAGQDFMSGGGRPQDQAMLKLALQSVVQDFLGEPERPAWSEWLSGGRLGAIVMCDETAGPAGRLKERAEECRQWIADNFGVDFVFAVGIPVRDWEELPASYDSAAAALGYKLTGGGKVLAMGAGAEGFSEGDTYPYWARLSEIAKSFRLVHEGWKPQLERLFSDFRDDRLSDRHIHMLVTALDKLLKKEIGMGGEASAFQTAGSSIDIDRILAANNSLDRLEEELTESLNGLFLAYAASCESDGFQAVILEMRAYIEEQFDNPDLSLKHLSDRFGLNGKNVSQLFKDAFGENFGEVLLRLRIDKAKRLLTETSMAQQDIAQKVGYSNSITFGRMFKRIVGVTPGEYRKKHAASPL